MRRRTCLSLEEDVFHYDHGRWQILVREFIQACTEKILNKLQILKRLLSASYQVLQVFLQVYGEGLLVTMHHFGWCKLQWQRRKSIWGSSQIRSCRAFVDSQLYRRNPKRNIKALSNKAASQAKHDNNGVHVAEKNS